MASKAKLDPERLCQAVADSRKVLEKSRTSRRNMIAQSVGAHWSNLSWSDSTFKKQPVNLVSLYISIVGRNLIAKNPRVMLSTFDRALKPTVSAMQTWANKEIDKMKLADILRRCVHDALFSWAIAKVCLATPADAAVSAWNVQAGQAMVSRVDLDDWVWDTNAREKDECCFQGHRYRVPFEVIAESDLFSKKLRSKLAPSRLTNYNEQGDEKTASLGRGDGTFDEYEDFIDLWEIYLPRHRAVLTFVDDEGVGPGLVDNEPLREQTWVGPYCGPYHVLGYGIVPGNLNPKGPIQDLIDLHEAYNRTFRKIVRQVDRQKEIVFVQGKADADGKRTIDANDGDTIRVDNPDAIKPVVYGGAHPNLIVVSQLFKDLFNFAAGNLATMGGLTPEAGTATQEKMLNQNAGAGLADKQEQTLNFVSDVTKALLWYWHNDPFKVMRTDYALPGLQGVSLTRNVYPDPRKSGMASPPKSMTRTGKFEDLDIKVDPYSLSHTTPQARMQGIIQMIKEVYMPMAQLAAQQGIQLDLNVLFKKLGEYMDQPDLADILTLQEPVETQASSGGAPGGMPQSTERTYTRKNVPMRTDRGNTQNLLNSMMGVDAGGAQKNGSANGSMAGAY